MANILAIDDDHDLCALLKTALERDGHTVETRTSGTQMKVSYTKLNTALYIIVQNS